MKKLLSAAVLLAATVPAFADHTPFVAPQATAPVPVSTREPSKFVPYSRDAARFETPAPRQDASTQKTERLIPYSRNQSRFSVTHA